MPADVLVLPYQRNHARFSIMGINSFGCWVLAFLTINNMSDNILLGVTKYLEYPIFENNFLTVYMDQNKSLTYDWVLWNEQNQKQSKRKSIANFDMIRRHMKYLKRSLIF